MSVFYKEGAGQKFTALALAMAEMERENRWLKAKVTASLESGALLEECIIELSNKVFNEEN